jgi:DNA repair protein RecO (recombination protein O)
MLHSTKGIVLRSVKYGDTSIIVSIYTELFGIQSYIVNGVRTERKSANKANIYQPATLLDIVVYHHPNKNLQRIKEARVYYLYNSIQQSAMKNAIAIYMAELIWKTTSEPETNQELFDYFEHSFCLIDEKSERLLVDFPIQFTIELAHQLGFGMQAPAHIDEILFDVNIGRFVLDDDYPHSQLISKEHSAMLATFLQTNERVLSLNQTKRQELLAICIQYLRLHIPQMGELKSPDVLHAVMS